MRQQLAIATLAAYVSACSAGIGAKFGVGAGGGSSGGQATAPAGATPEQNAGVPGAAGQAVADAAAVEDSKAMRELVKVDGSQINGGFSGALGLDLILDPRRGVYYIAHKVGPVETTSCADRLGYAPFEAATPPAKHLELAGPDGPTKVCVVSVSVVPAPNMTFPIEGADEFVVIIDRTGPILPEPADILAAAGGPGEVTLSFGPASDLLADAATLTYQVFYGDPSVTDAGALAAGGSPADEARLGVDGRTISGLTPGDSYAITVAVKDPAGNAAYYPVVIYAVPGTEDPGNGGGDPGLGHGGGDPGAPGSFVFSQLTDLDATESGATAAFDVRLDKAPTHDVTISVASAAPDQALASPATLTFTPIDWNNPHVVTVTALHDFIDDGDQTFGITLGAAVSGDPTFAGVDPLDPTGTTHDVDVAGIVRTPADGLKTTEGGGAATFTVVLNSKPTANVVLGVFTGDISEGGVAPATLTFTPADWNVAQIVTVTGASDGSTDGNVAYEVNVGISTTMDSVYAALPALTVGVTNVEMGSFIISQTSGIVAVEYDVEATFNVRLSKQPTANVTIAISNGTPAQIDVAASSFTFTPGNWNVDQTVEVLALYEGNVDGNLPFVVGLGAATSTDLAFNGVNPPDPTGTANDANFVGIVYPGGAAPHTSENGAAVDVAVRLGSKPTANVTFSVAVDNTEGSLSASTLTFTPSNWNTPQTITVTGSDDGLTDGNITHQLSLSVQTTTDGAYLAMPPANFAIVNDDDEVPLYGITATPSSGLSTSEVGASDSFTIVLNSLPTDSVTLYVYSNNDGEGDVDNGHYHTFTTGNWNSPQTVNVSGRNDPSDDGDQAYQFVVNVDSTNDVNYQGVSSVSVGAVNTDNEGGHNSGALGAFSVTGAAAAGYFDSYYGIKWTASTNADSYSVKVYASNCTTLIETKSGMADLSIGSFNETYVDGTTYCIKVEAVNDGGTLPATNSPLLVVGDLQSPISPSYISIKIIHEKVMLTVDKPVDADFAGFLFVRNTGPTGDDWAPQSGVTYNAGDVFRGGLAKVACKGTKSVCIDALATATDALWARFKVYAYDYSLHYQGDDPSNIWRAPARHMGGIVNDVECATINAKNLCFASSEGLGVYTFDMTNPSAPKISDLSPVPGELAHGIAKGGTKIYVADGAGMTVIDATNAGTGTSASIAHIFRPNDIYDVAARPGDDYAFILSYPGRLDAINVSNPDALAVTKSLSGLGANMLELSGNDLYVANAPAVKSVNGDPSAGAAFLTQLDTLTLSSNQGAPAFAVDAGKMLFFEKNYGIQPVEIVSPSDIIDRPPPDFGANCYGYHCFGSFDNQISGAVKVDDGGHEYWVVNAFNGYFADDSETGVRVMEWLGFGGTPRLDKLTAKDLVYARADSGPSYSIRGKAGMGRFGTKLFASEYSRGFSIIDASNIVSGNLAFDGRFPWGDSSQGMALDDTAKLMYVSDGKDGIAVLDYAAVATSGYPKTIGASTLPNKQVHSDPGDGPFGMALNAAKTRLFVAMGDDSVQIVDVSTPSAPVDLGFVLTSLGEIESDPSVNTTPNPDEATVVFTVASWDPAIWADVPLGSKLEFRNNDNNGTGGEVLLVSVNPGARTIVVSGDNGDMTTLDAGFKAYRHGGREIGQIVAFENTGTTYFATLGNAYGSGGELQLWSFNPTGNVSTRLVARPVQSAKRIAIGAGHIVLARDEDIDPPNGDWQGFLFGFDIDDFLAAPSTAPYSFNFNTSLSGSGYRSVTDIMIDGQDVYTAEGNQNISRYRLTGSTMSYVGTRAIDGSSEDVRALVRVGDRVSAFHWTNCGDGCGNCAMSFVDISDPNDVLPGKTHLIPCEARGMFAARCAGLAGDGICSAASAGGMSFWQEAD